jgi:hypothetical protein
MSQQATEASKPISTRFMQLLNATSPQHNKGTHLTFQQLNRKLVAKYRRGACSTVMKRWKALNQGVTARNTRNKQHRRGNSSRRAV